MAGKVPVKLQVNELDQKLIFKIKKVVELSGFPVHTVNLYSSEFSIFSFALADQPLGAAVSSRPCPAFPRPSAPASNLPVVRAREPQTPRAPLWGSFGRQRQPSPQPIRRSRPLRIPPWPPRARAPCLPPPARLRKRNTAIVSRAAPATAAGGRVWNPPW